MKKIYVTQPSLPDIKIYSKQLEKIWQSKMLSNNGEILIDFENGLRDYLKIDNIGLISNGTLALLIALKAFDLKGEVITTPYSFVATTHVLEWLGLKTVFCDIEPETCNIDPNKIEELITEHTSAILPVHVYGNPCNHQKIQEIADKHNLKVIYDAAHAFGVEKDGESILNWGDASILSFHATKVFNTVEGGAVIIGDNDLRRGEGTRGRGDGRTSSESKIDHPSSDYGSTRNVKCKMGEDSSFDSLITTHDSLSIKRRVDLLRNFGISDEEHVELAGLNAKMNELICAYGLLQLETIDEEIGKRKQISLRYREAFADVKGIRLMDEQSGVKYNYSYFPIFIEKDKYGMSRDELYLKLKEEGIHARKYFYPLISNFSMYVDLPTATPEGLPIANRIANEVLCLPMYGDISLDDLNRVIHKIKTETI